MSLIRLLSPSTKIRTAQRTLSGPVKGGDGNPAVGRTVLVLARNEWGRWAVIAETVTDGSGNYSVTVNAGSNDRFLVVGVGDAGEYSRTLGDMTAVL